MSFARTGPCPRMYAGSGSQIKACNELHRFTLIFRRALLTEIEAREPRAMHHASHITEQLA